MNTQNPATASPIQVHADHSSQKRLGAWTTARIFQVRARRGQVVIDLDDEIQAGVVMTYGGSVVHPAIAARIEAAASGEVRT